MDNFGEILIYQSDNGSTNIEVKFQDETVWLTQQQMADLFQTFRTNVVEHIKHIYDEGELDAESTCRKFRQVRKEGEREVLREIPFYNLDMIISLGYRVKSVIATNFRRWATDRLKEYMIKGFAIDDERLKGNGGGNYWKELLDRIRDIRSSEKVLYRQVLDLYATSVDYDPNSEESVKFFKIVQNKLHYAAHGHTAAEVIYERADAEKPFMGLLSFSGELPALKDIGIAKNNLQEDELKILNNLVSGYFDLAEINAIEHKPMYMEYYVKQLDMILSSGNRKLLVEAGSVSHKQAMDKAASEYRKYQENTLTPIEQAYLESIKEVSKEVKKKK
ncbi:MAG: virulence RhuM family protein [Eubacterium sp.]|nr:virulence RhuM family protein [Eubacterium sp.]